MDSIKFILVSVLTLSISWLCTSANEEIISDVTEQRLKDIERSFNILLERTKTEMEYKYESLLEDHIALKNDHEQLKKNVRFLRRENNRIKLQLYKWITDFIPEKRIQQSTKPRQSTHRDEINPIFFNVMAAENKTHGTENESRGIVKSTITNMKENAIGKRLLMQASTPHPQTTPAPVQPRVAFFARMSRNLMNPGNNQHIEFDDVITNVGDAYLPRTAVFVTPVAGTYVFYLTMMTFPDKYLEIEIVLNGNRVVKVYSDNDHHYGTGSNLVVLNLSERDEVWVRVLMNHQNTGNVGLADYSTFSGFLLG